MLFKAILKHRKVYLAMFVWALFLGCLPLNASAMPIDSKVGISITDKVYQNDLETVSNFLEEEAVSKKLAKLGLSSEQIMTKLASMDREQVHMLASRIKTVEKAGDAAGVAIVILALLLLLISFLYFTGRRVKVEREYQ